MRRQTTQDNSPQDAADLERWQGRRHALAASAQRYSAADVASLRNIRAKKLYRVRGLTWSEFCQRLVGTEYHNVNEWIRNLEEFGPVFFQMGAVVRITPRCFRRIAHAVNERGLFSGAGRIPFETANSLKLAQAIAKLSHRSRPAPQDSASRLQRAQTRLKQALAELELVSTAEMDILQRQSLHLTIDRAMDKLGQLSYVVPQ